MQLNKIRRLEFNNSSGISELDLVQAGFVKKLTGEFSGNGIATDFIITHNKNTENVMVQIREVDEDLKEVLVENFPESSDPKNKIRIRFQSAPLVTQSFRIIIV